MNMNHKSSKKIKFIAVQPDDNINIDAKGDGKTALMYACIKGNSKIVDLLLEYGANMDLTDNNGKTAFMLAHSAGHIDCLCSFFHHVATLPDGAIRMGEMNKYLKDNKKIEK